MSSKNGIASSFNCFYVNWCSCTCDALRNMPQTYEFDSFLTNVISFLTRLLKAMLTRNNNRSTDHFLYSQNRVLNCVVFLRLYHFPAWRTSRAKTHMNNFLFTKSGNTAHMSTILLYVYANENVSKNRFIPPLLICIQCLSRPKSKRVELCHKIEKILIIHFKFHFVLRISLHIHSRCRYVCVCSSFCNWRKPVLKLN